ncbi:MAG: hypothetical protein U0T82_07765 [Bacteroidales bacterium]
MHKWLITVYKFLGFIINPLIILAMLFWLADILFGNATQTLSYLDYITGVLLSWASITWFYYISKTKGIRKLSGSNVVDPQITGDRYLARFRFDNLIGITNIVLASALIIYSIYIMLVDPIKIKPDGEEIWRGILIYLSLLYSALQIHYSLTIFKVQKK